MGQAPDQPLVQQPLPSGAELEGKKRNALLRAFLSGPLGLVVECGAIRSVQPWGDGRFTLLLAELCRVSGLSLISLDLSPATCDLAKKCLEVAWPNGAWTVRQGDAAELLAQIAEPITLLLLDTSDNPDDTLRQFEAAKDRLIPGARVVVDDCHPYLDTRIPMEWVGAMPEGKGTALLPMLRSQGWSVTCEWMGDDARMCVATKPIEQVNSDAASQPAQPA